MTALPPSDRPTDGEPARTSAQMYAIVCHPAFRIGFLDGQEGRAFDHDSIMARIVAETPQKALERIHWPWSATQYEDHLSAVDLVGWSDRIAENREKAVALAQWRYEEGRRLSVEHGVRCKAWGHPDFPPAAVQRFIASKAA